MAGVERWESKSIERIRQVANEVRSQLRETLTRKKRTIVQLFADITRELVENRQTETYTEKDLDKWMDQLKQLKEQMNKPLVMAIRNDEDDTSSTQLPLIRLQMLEGMKSKETKSVRKRFDQVLIALCLDLFIQFLSLYLFSSFVHHCSDQMGSDWPNRGGRSWTR